MIMTGSTDRNIWDGDYDDDHDGGDDHDDDENEDDGVIMAGSTDRNHLGRSLGW